MKLDELQGEHSCLVASALLCACVCVFLCVRCFCSQGLHSSPVWPKGQKGSFFSPCFLTRFWENTCHHGFCQFLQVSLWTSEPWTHTLKERDQRKGESWTDLRERWRNLWESYNFKTLHTTTSPARTAVMCNVLQMLMPVPALKL